jgi:hypothetical protein
LSVSVDGGAKVLETAWLLTLRVALYRVCVECVECVEWESHFSPGTEES